MAKELVLTIACPTCTPEQTCQACAVQQHGGYFYDLDDSTGRWTFICCCGSGVMSDRLLSKVEAYMDTHYGQPAHTVASIGAVTVEV